ncbi:MAG: hypothetical protein AAGJ97_15730, partial [Planctomycetota bacterium]
MNGERRPLWSRPADLLRGVRNKIFGDRGERAAGVVFGPAGRKKVATNEGNRGGVIDLKAPHRDVRVLGEVNNRPSPVAGP